MMTIREGAREALIADLRATVGTSLGPYDIPFESLVPVLRRAGFEIAESSRESESDSGT